MAETLLREGDRRAGGSEAVGSAAGVRREVVAEVKAMACALLSEREVPLSRWSSAELAARRAPRDWWRRCGFHGAALVGRGRDQRGSSGRGSSARPRLRGEGRLGAGSVRAVWDGEDLGENEYVISADEKSQLQALSRCHPELAAALGRARRVESSTSGTARWPISALRRAPRAADGQDRGEHRDRPVHRAGGSGDDHRTVRSAERVFWIVDNGASHAGKASIARMGAAWRRDPGAPAGARVVAHRSRSCSR